jgi:CDP-glycerol glycerophosphotransferase
MRGGVRLKRSLQRLSAETARRTGLPVRAPRLLSVVVTVAGDAPVEECLESLRRQHLEGIEVVVVDLGTSGPVATAVRRHVQDDARIRTITAHGGLAAGRNAGAEEAVGEYLAFVDADDAVTPHGLGMAAAALRDTEADLVVLGHRPFRRGQVLPVDDRVRALHAVRRDGATLASFPDALADTVTGGRVFRRKWYDAAGLRFDESLTACDDAHSVAAYLAAGSFVVLPHVGLLRRVDLDRTPLTRLAADVDGLTAWWAGLRSALRLLPTGLAEVAAAETVAGPLVPFTDRAWRCPDDYWESLREVVAALRQHAGAEARGRVPAYQKVLTRLVADGDRDGVRRLLTQVRPTPRRYATEVSEVGGRRSVVVDLGPDWSAVDPAERVLSDVETGVRAELTGLRDLGDGRISLQGWAFLDNVDLTDRAAELRLTARSGDASVTLDVVAEECPDADVASDLWYADVTASGFRAEVDTSALRGGTGLWHLEATVAVAGLSGTGRVQVRPWTMAGVPAWRDAAGRGWHLDHDDAHRVELRVGDLPWSGVAVEVDGDRAFLHFPAGSVRSVSMVAPGHTPVVATLSGSTAELPLRLTGGVRAVHAVDRSGAGREVPWPGGPVADVRVRPSRRGVLTVSPSAAEVVTAELRGESVVVGLRVSGAEVPEAALLVGETAVRGVVRHLDGSPDDGLVEAVLPLVRTQWGVPDLPLPSGQYAVAVRTAGEAWAVAAPSAGLCATLPVEELQERMRVRLEAFRPDDPGLRVVVEPPLADDERGQRHQRLLREAARVETADRDAVFFRAMFSEYANGNGLGLHEELVRRGSSLELLWSVLDRSVVVPDGGVGVVERSRAWHDAVARARYHMVDVHQLEWFVRPREQVLIQTFHGYPYKVMGHDWWEKMGNPVQEIGSLDRRTREWSALVSPAPYATPLLRAAFLEPADAGGVPVLETGYPRNDALLRPEAADLRARTRALLGLDDEAVAVLYAPTFRDYLSAEDRTARTVDFFDTVEALDRLPENYVVLMRGHAFNARIRTERLAARDRLVDVTDHPDVNHLILASDAGVLDYSSLRFDYVLSGNPMVFLVPDLAEYDAARGGVIPYAPTAPGPHVSTTAEVVHWLSDLPRLAAEYADARARFRADYVGLEDGRSAARLVDALFTSRGDG